MTREEAIEIARQVAAEHDWPWLEPVEAHRTREGWFSHRRNYWIVRTNVRCRGCNIHVVIDEATGQVHRKAFAPR